MKIQLDTQNLVIRLDETVNLKEFYNLLKKILPDKEWEKYSLEVVSQMVWSNPIYIQPYIQPNTYPWWNPNPIIYGTGDHISPGMTTDQGTYNLEVQS